jgi:hypothetical protein
LRPFNIPACDFSLWKSIGRRKHPHSIEKSVEKKLFQSKKPKKNCHWWRLTELKKSYILERSACFVSDSEEIDNLFASWHVRAIEKKEKNFPILREKTARVDFSFQWFSINFTLSASGHFHEKRTKKIATFYLKEKRKLSAFEKCWSKWEQSSIFYLFDVKETVEENIKL